MTISTFRPSKPDSIKSNTAGHTHKKKKSRDGLLWWPIHRYCGTSSFGKYEFQANDAESHNDQQHSAVK